MARSPLWLASRSCFGVLLEKSAPCVGGWLAVLDFAGRAHGLRRSSVSPNGSLNRAMLGGCAVFAAVRLAARGREVPSGEIERSKPRA